MVSTTTSTRPYQEVSDATLLGTYSSVLLDLERAQADVGKLRQEIEARMTEREAVGIPSDKYVCELIPTNTYAQERFTPLLEVFYETDLASCYTGEHEEVVTVPAKWDTQKVKAAAKRYGREALDIVEHTKIPGTPRLKFEPRNT